MNFEKTRKATAPRRNADEMEVVRARKGKHQKPQRGNDNWANARLYSTAEGCERLHEASIRFSNQRPAWEML